MAYQIQYTAPKKDIAVGIKLPLVSTSNRLFEPSYSTNEQVLSNLRNLVLTRKGERIMEPFFGTDIYSSLFNNITERLLADIKSSIASAIEFWMPYVTIESLEVTAVEAVDQKTQATEHGVTVTINISVNGQRINQPVTFLLTDTARQTLTL
jgi:phage baseplate assembly protein W